jgi:hypothetical protein
MALDHLHLAVQWPDGRQVTVDILILPDFDTSSASNFRFFKVAGELPTEEIGPDDADSLPLFHRFLARLTRTAAADEERHVSCDRMREEQILELLEITGPPPDPIPVKLSADD